jgi:hypothetical protein
MLTCYYFGQGTYRGDECPSYKTACGYCGTESGSGQACSTSVTDTVDNISTGAYFAAIAGFGSGDYCGLCVDITYNGTTITATIIDHCATCSDAGHLDLSNAAAAALGITPEIGQVSGVASASANGQTATQSNGFWDFGSALEAGTTITLTDALGHTITGTIPGSSGGSTGAQFPATCE